MTFLHAKFEFCFEIINCFLTEIVVAIQLSILFRINNEMSIYLTKRVYEYQSISSKQRCFRKNLVSPIELCKHLFDGYFRRFDAIYI